MWAGQDGNSGDPAGPFGPSVANKILSDSSVDKAAVKYQAYSSAMPFVANSFFAFSFLAKCIISGHFAMEKAMSALAPNSRHVRCNSPRPLCANSGHSPSFDHFVGAAY